MTFKGAKTTTTQACAACKHQRKRCTPECALAPHFRPEQPTIFKNAHKLFGVRNILRILQQINPHHKTDAMRSIIYEANMRDLFPVHGCLTVIYDLRCQIRQAEEELRSILYRLAFLKQHHERQQMTILSPVACRDSIPFGMAVIQHDNTSLMMFLRHNVTTSFPISSFDNNDTRINALWLQETNNKSNGNNHKPLMLQPSVIEEEAIHENDENFPFFDTMEDSPSYID